jgi:tripartite-type tricarboxylate transporter receptor subunit TctC
LALAAVPGLGRAQTSDGGATRIVVGFPPGQTIDTIARTYAAALSKELGTTVIVDNRPGANGILAASEVKRAAPDGKTLFFAGSGPLAINPSLYKHLPYEAKDFAPVSLITSGSMVLIATPSFPPNNIAELVAYAKAHPGQVNFGSGGQGITGHLGMELLQDALGIKLTHVPYKGSPAALTDLMAGRISMMMEPAATVIPHIRSGRIKAIGVSSSKRNPAYPEIAPIAEQGVGGFEVTSWAAVVVRAGTPDTTIAILNAALQRAAKTPIVVESLKAAGVDNAVGTPQQLGAFWQSEIKTWAKAVQRSGVQLDN